MGSYLPVSVGVSLLFFSWAATGLLMCPVAHVGPYVAKARPQACPHPSLISCVRPLTPCPGAVSISHPTRYTSGGQLHKSMYTTDCNLAAHTPTPAPRRNHEDDAWCWLADTPVHNAEGRGKANAEGQMTDRAEQPNPQELQIICATGRTG